MITKSLFGKLEDGREVYRYRLVNKAGIEMGLIDYGAIMTHLITPDRDGKMGDIVLGYDQLADYVRDTAHLGAIVGRYANRIAGGRFSIGRQRFTLNKNEGNNHLHGGPGGFHKVLWQGEIQKNPRGESVRFSYHSPDGEEGYPGNLILRVTFTLSDLNELHIEYSGETDRTTILNPTHHSYYNLSGNFATSIEGHQIQINADRFTPVNNELIPTGAIEEVSGTPMDFRIPRTIGELIDVNYSQLRSAGGYDHNWVINRNGRKIRHAASVYDPNSGRFLELFTNQPGIQFYAGNFLNGSLVGKGGIRYRRRSGICLETQHFPDSPNQANFPPVILKPGETYRQYTIYAFSVR